MAKKRKGRKPAATGQPVAGATRSKKKKRVLNGPTLVFIGLIVLAAAAIAIASVFSDSPECPPGQVWSAAHNHCH